MDKITNFHRYPNFWGKMLFIPGFSANGIGIFTHNIPLMLLGMAIMLGLSILSVFATLRLIREQRSFRD